MLFGVYGRRSHRISDHHQPQKAECTFSGELTKRGKGKRAFGKQNFKRRMFLLTAKNLQYVLALFGCTRISACAHPSHLEVSARDMQQLLTPFVPCDDASLITPRPERYFEGTDTRSCTKKGTLWLSGVLLVEQVDGSAINRENSFVVGYEVEQRLVCMYLLADSVSGCGGRDVAGGGWIGGRVLAEEEEEEEEGG
jgi:hypothetical protein